MLCAVLTRRAGLELGSQDVYVNVSGGVRIEERAADLGVALAITSALRDRPVGARTACFGEVGLDGGPAVRAGGLAAGGRTAQDGLRAYNRA